MALAVAAIPEGLAVVITTCLALGTRKMAAKNAIVRSLPSVETLGSTSVICSDKTGTLTTNQMSVSKIFIIGDTGQSLQEYEVEGTTFSPEGIVSVGGKQILSPASSNSCIRTLAEIAAVCNDAGLSYDATTGSFSNIGEPTEAALRVLVEKLGTGQEKLDAQINIMPPYERLDAVNTYYETLSPRVTTFEFSRDRKSMSVLTQTESLGPRLLVKGAPESVIARCDSVIYGRAGTKIPLTPYLRDLLAERLDEYACQGLRMLAFAIVEDMTKRKNNYHNAKTSQDYLQYERNMTLVAVVAMLDPPRPEVADAITRCYDAGIRVVVITGDNQHTAESICRQIGVFTPDEDLRGKSYTGREFDEMTPEQQFSAAQTANLFSRTEPFHKSLLVDLLQSSGQIVAMTGDGVNDAPALKKADIGIAMGSGTDVAKLAADMVLADDNFATIELAVEEGRSIYNNTQQFIRYLISSNIGEVVSIFLTVLLGMPEALIPVQLLWVNLVTGMSSL